jgi:ribose-phosphate pyrophosphokinase
MHKRRTGVRETKTTHIVGDIKDRIPIIIDDIIASGSVLKQIDSLNEGGATGKAFLAITHPVLLPTALDILDTDDRIEKLIVTNTLPIPKKKLHPKIEVLSIAPLLAEIIRRIHVGKSISPKISHF